MLSRKCIDNDAHVMAYKLSLSLFRSEAKLLESARYQLLVDRLGVVRIASISESSVSAHYRLGFVPRVTR